MGGMHLEHRKNFIQCVQNRKTENREFLVILMLF